VRITKHPVIHFPERRRVKFLFDGREIEGFEDEPIAAALIAQGIRVFSRSPRHGRARGFFCAIGNCSSCLMQVDGIANVRICVTKLAPGMRVETQRGRGHLVEKD